METLASDLRTLKITDEGNRSVEAAPVRLRHCLKHRLFPHDREYDGENDPGVLPMLLNEHLPLGGQSYA